jgi:hypothetical protein
VLGHVGANMYKHPGAPSRYGGDMAPETTVPDRGVPNHVIRFGGQEAAIVPLADLRRLQAVERLGPTEVVAGVGSGSRSEFAPLASADDPARV